MKKLIILLSLCGMVLIGCKKDDAPECEKNNTGTLQVISHESEEYEIQVDGVSYGSVGANETKYVTCGAGHVTVRFLEVNHAADSQKFYSGSVQVSACGSYPISFGN